jgi:hypothetical protein
VPAEIAKTPNTSTSSPWQFFSFFSFHFIYLFIYLFIVGTGFELGASHFLGRLYHLSHNPSLFRFLSFLSLDHNSPIYDIAGIPVMFHHTGLID